MEMQEKKKFMPTITNYLSDDDDFDECLQINSSSTQLQTNYKEWKKMQQTNSETTNGKRPRMRSDGTMEPLGDISSSEETYGIEDNDPMFKIIKTLSDKEIANRRNQRIRKKVKEPSMFLLFSRMKHLKYQNSSQDWTFNELCRVTHSSWENIQPSEQEELNDTLDQKICEYKESLQKFRSVLLPDANNRLKYKSWVSAAAANKGHLVSPVVNDLKDSSQTTIPERLQNLVGKASVYHASVTPNKSNHNSRHSLFSFRSTITNNNDYLSETSLNYVANVMETCKYDSCTNKPVQDNRWDGQYCSAKCLINDCRDTFHNWLAEQKQPIMPSSETNGTNSKSPRLSSAGDDEEIMQYLASPPTAENNNNNSDDDSEDSINRDENLFASLQQHYFPGENIVDIIRPSNDELQMGKKYGFTTHHHHITDIDDEDNENGVVLLPSPIKLQNNSQVLPDLSTNQRNSSVAVISSSSSSHSDR